MNVDIEFFDEDPMSNILSCTKFSFSKVIFLGYVEEDMDRVATSTVAAFLKSPEIGVEEIEFVAVPEGRLDDIEKKLTEIVVREKEVGNRVEPPVQMNDGRIDNPGVGHIHILRNTAGQFEGIKEQGQFALGISAQLGEVLLVAQGERRIQTGIVCAERHHTDDMGVRSHHGQQETCQQTRRKETAGHCRWRPDNRKMSENRFCLCLLCRVLILYLYI